MKIKEFFRILLSNRIWLLIAFGLIGCLNGKGQPGRLVFNVQIPEIALVDVEPSANNNLTLSLAAPTEAGSGNFQSSSEDNSLWLNYTCSRSRSGPYRNIYVQSEGMIPEGIQIRLLASPHSAGGGGVFGSPSGSPLVISNSPQVLISGIGGCFTGDGVGYGHQLHFTVDISDYSGLNLPETVVIQLTYTIADF